MKAAKEKLTPEEKARLLQALSDALLKWKVPVEELDEPFRSELTTPKGEAVH